jgi:hypothetical protein
MPDRTSGKDVPPLKADSLKHVVDNLMNTTTQNRTGGGASCDTNREDIDSVVLSSQPQSKVRYVFFG